MIVANPHDRNYKVSLRHGSLFCHSVSCKCSVIFFIQAFCVVKSSGDAFLSSLLLTVYDGNGLENGARFGGQRRDCL